MKYTIPKGQKLKIRYYSVYSQEDSVDNASDARDKMRKNWDYINKQTFCLDGGSQINIYAQSSFSSISSLLPNNSNTAGLVTLVSGLIDGLNRGRSSTLDKASSLITSHNKVEGYQYWTGTGPLRVDGLTVQFFADGDAYTNVVCPLSALMKCAVPEVNQLGGLVPPGPGITNMFTKKSPGRCVIGIGSLYFDNVLITNVNPQVSSAVDENGDPMTATAIISFSSMDLANGTMIDNIFGIEDQKRAISPFRIDEESLTGVV